MGMVIDQSPTNWVMPSGRITKPALLKMDTAMNAACHRDSGQSWSRVKKRGNSTRVRRNWAVNAVITTARISVPTSPSRVNLVSEAVNSRWVSPMCRETASDRSEARVMTPRPPTRAESMIMVCPKADQ